MVEHTAVKHSHRHRVVVVSITTPRVRPLNSVGRVTDFYDFISKISVSRGIETRRGYALVAKLDNATDFYSVDWRFESSRGLSGWTILHMWVSLVNTAALKTC